MTNPRWLVPKLPPEPAARLLPSLWGLLLLRVLPARGCLLPLHLLLLQIFKVWNRLYLKIETWSVMGGGDGQWGYLW